MKQKLPLLVLCTAIVLFGTAASRPNGAAGFNFGDWQVNTGEFVFNYQSGTFNAPSPIVLTRPGNEIRANRGSGNYKTKQATLSGNVWLRDQTGALTGLAGAHGNQPATLTCDTLQIDGVSKIYTAMSNVHFTQGSSYVTADRAVMNGITHDLHLYGHVILHQ